MKLASLKQKSAVIVIHESSGGPGHDLKLFLLNQKINKLLLISHPLLYFKDGLKKSSRFELYHKGKLIKTGKGMFLKMPEPLLYIKDFLYTIYWTLKYCSSSDLFFGVDNLNAFTGLFIKLISQKTKIIYYVIDYIPKRFENRILNFVYHFIEKTAATYSSQTWNLSPRMIEGRELKWKRAFPNQIIIPYGIYFKRIKRIPFERINKHEIIFMGSLLEKQGVQLVIKALSAIKKKIPNIRLVIIGKGPYEKNLKKLTARLELGKNVLFLGHIESHEEMENRIAKAAIAVALYDPKNADFSYYADPGKIKNYLGAGVPVIMTDVPYIAKQIEKEKCGMISPYNKSSISKVMIDILKNENKLDIYRKNAVKFSNNFDWNIIYRKAILSI